MRDLLDDKQLRAAIASRVRRRVMKLIADDNSSEGGSGGSAFTWSNALRFTAALLSVLLAGGSVALDRETSTLSGQGATLPKLATTPTLQAIYVSGPPESDPTLAGIASTIKALLNQKQTPPPGTAALLSQYPVLRKPSLQVAEVESFRYGGARDA